MCSAYWNLNVSRLACPGCGASEDESLQTHFMGEFGSSDNFYEMGDAVPEMLGFTGTVKPPMNDLIGTCENDACEMDSILYGFEVEDGRVTSIWPEQWYAYRGAASPQEFDAGVKGRMTRTIQSRRADWPYETPEEREEQTRMARLNEQRQKGMGDKDFWERHKQEADWCAN